jgi:molecular chaperone GrpE
MIDPIDMESLLSRFRQWLQEAHTEAEALEPEPPAHDALDHEVGLYRLVEEFTALRHELKLQTKSARGLQEQTESFLPALRQALEQFRPGEPRRDRTAWDAGKPLAEGLGDLDESLERGRVEIEKAQPRLVDEPDAALLTALDALLARHWWPRRLWYRGYHAKVRAVVARQGPETRRPFFDALLEGYDLIRSRLRRALEAAQIERIACLGQPVDPERMIVLEVVEDPDRPPGAVIDEVRRGYTWQGRVFRYAEVRASRSPLPTWDESIEPNVQPEESTN